MSNEDIAKVLARCRLACVARGARNTQKIQLLVFDKQGKIHYQIEAGTRRSDVNSAYARGKRASTLAAAEVEFLKALLASPKRGEQRFGSSPFDPTRGLLRAARTLR